MHGRPRQKAGHSDPERVKAAQKKAALFGQLAEEVLSRRAAQRYDAESLALAGKLLELHPEVYTAWNYRREALVPVLAAGGEGAVSAVQAELALTERALRANPKSYAAWHHRKWAVAKGFSSLEHELALVGQLLEADERNFHGWGYRRFVVQLMGTPAARELEYAEHKINQNFSNYSAWHSRTTLLPVLHGDGGGGDSGGSDAANVEALAAALAAAASLDESAAAAAAAGGGGGGGEGKQALAVGSEEGHAKQAQQADEQQAQQAQQAGADVAGWRVPARPPAGASSAAAVVPHGALDAEYELVKQAFYTEPEDQSGWFYHRWLLGCSLAHWEQARGTASEAGERVTLLAVLAREQQTCQELLEVEPDAKWPLLTLTRLQELEQQLLLQGSSGGSSSHDSGSNGGAEAAAHSLPETGASGSASGGASGGGSGSGSRGVGLAGQIAAGYVWLIELDPLRRGYYEDARDGRAHVVAKPTAAAPAVL